MKRLRNLKIILILQFVSFSLAAQVLKQEDSEYKLTLKSTQQLSSYISGLYGNKLSKTELHLHFPRVLSQLLAFSYTQDMFWKLHEESHPFANIDFSPKLSFGSLVLNENHNFWLTLFEHRSNGRSGMDSRSINASGISYFYKLPLNQWQFSIEATTKLFYTYDHTNTDYRRFGDPLGLTLSAQYRFPSLLLRSIAELNWGLASGIKFSLWRQRLELKYYDKSNWPTFLLESHYGYNESFLDYNKKTFILRIGISIGI